jgi:hypothetical protein
VHLDEIQAGTEAFREHESRDAMYKTATFLVAHFWGDPRPMADGMGVLLLTWNQAFYRYGPFSYDALEKCLVQNWQQLQALRGRNILSYSPADDSLVMELYSAFLSALQISEGKVEGRQSPVAASKALHLMAPAFFPLWDDKIATAYECHYLYIPFMRKMKALASDLAPQLKLDSSEKTLLKLIDEYNYAKFTKRWI